MRPAEALAGRAAESPDVLLDSIAVVVLLFLAVVVAVIVLAARRTKGTRSTSGHALPTARPACPAARGRDIERLGEVLERSRRLIAAENRVAQVLIGPLDGWIVERDVLVGRSRVPFVIVGTGGLVALGATDGGWTMRDLNDLATAAEQLRSLIPGYRGEAHAIVCLAFESSPARSWHGADTRWRCGWCIGLDDLWPWLTAMNLADGFSKEDLARLAAAAEPDWRRQSVVRLPAMRTTS